FLTRSWFCRRWYELQARTSEKNLSDICQTGITKKKLGRKICLTTVRQVNTKKKLAKEKSV
ncbi:MAG: hypothetical protein U9Q83_08290, partial [Bacteroidota bacterium]|nr:hypothetical protein [Bacteroidota bacterium]